MTIEERLQEFVKAGAGFTRALDMSGRSEPLAAAHLLPESGELWVCLVWPENEFAQHWRSFASVKDEGHYLGFYDQAGTLLYTVAGLDPDEKEAAQWERWNKPDDEEARRGRAFVRALEVRIIGTDTPKGKGDA